MGTSDGTRGRRSLGEQPAEEQREGDLRELRRLKREVAEPQPALRAVDLDPKARNQDGHKQQDCDAEERGREPQQPFRRDHGGDESNGDRDSQVQEVP